MTREVSLLANDQTVSLDYFVQGFVDHTIGGMLAALEEVGRLENVEVYIEGNEVTISLNGALIPINPFVSRIIRNTVVGMVSSLKGVGEPARVKITIHR
jgi:hypothetical protein